MEEVIFVKNLLKEQKYTILPENIAIGTVYKIHYFGDLEIDGLEMGYLYIPKGSGIKLHRHENDVERYKKIIGDLVINGEACDINICLIGKSHRIDSVNQDTIIATCKVSKRYLFETDISLNSEFFDNLITRKLVDKKVSPLECASKEKVKLLKG